MRPDSSVPRLTGESFALAAAFAEERRFTDDEAERWCEPGPDYGWADRSWQRLTPRATRMLLAAWYEEDALRKRLIERNMGA